MQPSDSITKMDKPKHDLTAILTTQLITSSPPVYNISKKEKNSRKKSQLFNFRLKHILYCTPHKICTQKNTQSPYTLPATNTHYKKKYI